MKFVYRLKLATALCVVAAVIAGAIVVGSGNKEKKVTSDLAELSKTIPKLSEDLAAGKFSKLPVLTYENRNKETFFALQIKPNLDPIPPRPRDILVLVDTSASQAGAALTLAKRIVKDLTESLSSEDRIAIWTVNIPKATKSLTNGFQGAKEAQSAIEILDQEYASGAVDLKNAIEQSSKEFTGKVFRQQVMLYLGDGESAYAPLFDKDRYSLADQLVASKISFFAVPLGLSIHPKNIHSFVSTTGGAVIRFVGDEVKDPRSPALTPFIARMNKAINTPVLMPSELKFTTQVKEVYPTKLPPLRSESPTLLVGKFVGAAPEKIEATVDGKVVDKAVSFSVKETVPAPEIDNYFLATAIHDQWHQSSFKEAPAMIRSDRALALAFEQSRLAVEELLTQGEWALGSGQTDVAKNLFVAVSKLDSNNAEAQAGLKVVEKIKKGDLTREQLRNATGPRIGTGIERGSDGTLKSVKVNLQDLAKDADSQPNAVRDDLLKQEEGRRAVQEQRATQVVRSTMDNSRRLLNNGDPKSAKDLLMAQRDAILNDPDIGNTVRQKLVADMEVLLRYIGSEGARIAQKLAEERELIAKSKALIVQQDEKRALEERTRERIRAFTTLMNQARFEDAYRESLVLIQESVNRGEPIPIEAQAVYQISQASANLREARELIRLREDRFLLTMMQVEKSHVPYPDEPPVHFPPAKVWKELTERRKRYAPNDLGGEVLSPKLQTRFNFLREVLNTSLPLERSIESPLREVIEYLEDVSSPPEAAKDPVKKVKILIDDPAFRTLKNDPNYRADEEMVRLPKLNGASLGTALRLLTGQLNGTYIVRADYIEITTAEAALRDKVIRVFPVEDLVVPIPNAINQQALNQSLAVLGQTFSLGGGFTGQPIAGAFGGFLGGGFQFGVGQQGGQQGGGQMGNAGNVGNLFQGNNVNLGVGGGITGFGGGSLGQFGNLGGQFGFQGGDQSTLLVTLITQVVARGEWDRAAAVLGGQGQQQQGPGNAGQDPTLDDPTAQQVSVDQLNSLGYYPPSRALVVRGSSRFHKGQNHRLGKSAMGIVNAIPNNGKAVAINDPKGKPQDLKAPPGKEGEKQALVQSPKEAPKNFNAKVIWEEAIAKGVTDPGLIIACSDFLAKSREFKHATELLKASLRKGLIAEPWAQEALAIALEASQGSQEDLERARVSSIDLDPTNASAYIRASKALSEMGNLDRAVTFCQQAAKLQPDLPDPYLNAMVYAGDMKEVRSDVSIWAANGLLARDWSVESKELHLQAQNHLRVVSEKLAKAGRDNDAKSVHALINGDKQRDLVVELRWTDGIEGCDLDLIVSESNGTVCSRDFKQTPGGGAWDGDRLAVQKTDEHQESYVAAEGFSGSYRIKVDRVWGKPLGNKANIRVTKHQGTPNQQVEEHTLDLTNSNSVVVILDQGRRTALAQIPLPSVAMNASRKPENNDQVLNKLRALTTPVYTGVSGGFGSPTGNATAEAFIPEAASPSSEISYQTRVRSNISMGLELQAQVTVSGKKNGSNVSVKPVFQSFNPNESPVKLSLIPGSE
jgi:tetratricopeptide (TPR) repeat protein